MVRAIYICDNCRRVCNSNALNRYALYSDYCSTEMVKRKGTKEISVCPDCAEMLMRLFLEKKEDKPKE